MKRREGEDLQGVAILAVLVLGGAAVAYGASVLHGIAAVPGVLLSVLLGHLAVPAAVVVLCVGVVVCRVVVTRRTLRSRRRLLVLASEEFDLTPDAVGRFASQLSRLRSGLGGWLDARARATRVLLESDESGRMRYVLEAAARDVPLVRAAAGVYGEVDLVDLDNAREPVGMGGSTLRAELVLARAASEPLRRMGLDPDPLQSFAAAMDAADVAAGERVEVALDLVPSGPRRRRRLQRRLLKGARRDRQPSVTDLLAGRNGRARGGLVDPWELVERRSELRGLDEKFGRGEPLMSMQVLVRCHATSHARARLLQQGVLSCFDGFAGMNHLRVRGVRLPGGFLGSDLPWARRRFDRRMDAGLFHPHRRGLVTPSEIAGLLKPPTKHCYGANVVRSGGAVLPAPPELPTFTGQSSLIPLGRVGGRGGGRLVGVPVDGTVFSYMAGRSRYGKTETAIGQFVHLVRAGHGGLFLDPHSDAIREIKTYLTDDEDLRGRVVEIDLTGRGDQPGWNLLAGGDPTDRVEAVVDAMAATMGWDERNTRALNLATQAVQALVELREVLEPELAPTIFQLPTLLSDAGWREVVLPHLRAGTREFFELRFPKLPGEAVTAVTNLVDRLRAAPPVAGLLGQAISTYDVREAMEEGLIVLACPGSGATRDELVASFLVYDVLHAAKARAHQPPDQRRPFWIFLDELQTYDGPNLPVLLEQSAKYGGRAFMFNQNPERLTTPTWNAVTTNRSHLSSAAVNAKAAGMLAREWGGEPAAQTITQLERYTYLASVTLGDRLTKPFLVHGLPAHQLHAEHRHPDQVSLLERAIDKTLDRKPLDQVLAAVDLHGERIRKQLEAAGEDGPDDGTDSKIARIDQ